MRTQLLVILLFISINLSAQKPRLIVTTDIGQDPDDAQSMVRLLHYANEFDIEGIIANADVNYENEPPQLKDYIIHDMIDAYGTIEANLRMHHSEYPTALSLHSVVKKGCFGNGEKVPYNNYIGEGKDTEGSDWIIDVVDKDDDRVVNVSVWGGACDLAQALWKIRNTRSDDEMRYFIRKLRVYFIGKQDSSNDWIIENFPGMWLILAQDIGGDKWESGYRGMFWGGDMRITSKVWLHENIIGLNPLANMYPDQAYTGGENKNPYMAMKEGDSPSFLYFLHNGLNSPEHPSWGGWGGRFRLERTHFYRDADDAFYDEQSGKVINSPRAAVFRWRPDFQDDFATRVKWASQSHEQANHYPQLMVNGSSGKSPLIIQQNANTTLRLDASGSNDPNGNTLLYRWMIYPEAGTYEGDVVIEGIDKNVATLHIPGNAQGKTLHIILQIKDNIVPGLSSYKRIVIEAN